MDIAPLLRRIQEGDEQAFKAFIEQYSGKVLRTAYLITGRKDIAEDAVQKAFVQCYRKIKGLRVPAVFEAWFYRLLTRICSPDQNMLAAYYKRKKTVSILTP